MFAAFASMGWIAERALNVPTAIGPLVETALNLYWKNGKVVTTDGPYAETKEQLGGISSLRRGT